MTQDFRAFFDLVQKAAKDHGIGAFIVCGVAPDGTGSNVRVASSGYTAFDGASEQFMERCFDAMFESIDTTLTRLSNGEDEGDDERPKFVN